jgi:hypothetical protein
VSEGPETPGSPPPEMGREALLVLLFWIALIVGVSKLLGW